MKQIADQIAEESEEEIELQTCFEKQHRLRIVEAGRQQQREAADRITQKEELKLKRMMGQIAYERYKAAGCRMLHESTVAAAAACCSRSYVARIEKLMTALNTLIEDGSNVPY